MQNLSQRYRPGRLDDIAGHLRVQKTIKSRATLLNFPQTTLFLGPHGTGKSTFARIVAMIIRCSARGNDGNPCGTCRTCLDMQMDKFSGGTFRYNAANLGAEGLREMIEMAKNPSIFGGPRIFILEELQELCANPKAQKILLDFTEDYIPDVYIIMTAMDRTRVDPALESRAECHVLSPLKAEEIIPCLLRVCEGENIAVDDDRIRTLAAIAEYSGGSVRQAIASLETCIVSDSWEDFQMSNQPGIIDDDQLLRIAHHLLAGEPDSVFKASIRLELLRRLTSILLLAYGSTLGFTLKSEDLARVAGLDRFHMRTVRQTLKTLLLSQPQNTTAQSEFALLDCIRINQNISGGKQ